MEMITKFRSERIWNGFSLDVLKSALQKYIRRSNVEMAYYVAMELDMFRHADGGKRILTNFYHRLMVIFIEDIGLGNYEAWQTVDSYIRKR